MCVISDAIQHGTCDQHTMNINISLLQILPVAEVGEGFQVFPFSVFCFSLQALPPSVIQPKAQVVIIPNILVKRLVRRMEGDAEECAGDGSVRARGT